MSYLCLCFIRLYRVNYYNSSKAFNVFYFYTNCNCFKSFLQVQNIGVNKTPLQYNV